jgi:hypothetical protein
LAIGISAIKFLDRGASVAWVSIDYVGNAGTTVLPVVYEVDGFDGTYSSEEPLGSVSDYSRQDMILRTLRSSSVKSQWTFSTLTFAPIWELYNISMRADVTHGSLTIPVLDHGELSGMDEHRATVSLTHVNKLFFDS